MTIIPKSNVVSMIDVGPHKQVYEVSFDRESKSERRSQYSITKDGRTSFREALSPCIASMLDHLKNYLYTKT